MGSEGDTGTMLRRLPLLGRLMGKSREPEREPLSSRDAAKLRHRARVLERELRRLEKALKRRHCATCVQSPTDPNAVKAERRVDALRSELRAIRKRVGEA